MIIGDKYFLNNSVTDDKRFVDFGDGNKVQVDDILPADFVENHEVPPSGWWRRWNNIDEVDREDKEEAGDSVITEKVIRKHLGHLFVRHFLLGDVEAKPATVELLNNQAMRLGVADIPYNFPDYDCEDRSFACMGAWHLNAETAKVATYIAWVTYVRDGETRAHALNALCTDRAFFFYEPALYKVFEIPDFWMLNVLMG